MEPLAIACIALGVLIIVARAPLLVAPDATLDAYRGLIATDARARVTGVILLAMGVPTIAVAWGPDEVAAQVLRVLGWLFTSGGFFVGLFPAAYRRIGMSALDFVSASIDSAILRIVGAIAITVGCMLIYAGLFLI